MKTYTYRAIIERGDVREWVASFPDVPEAITQAATIDEARQAAQEALGLALLSYPARGRPLPERRFVTGPAQPDDTQAHDADISPAPDVTAKLALLESFMASGRSPDELGVMLGGKSDVEVRDILDPFGMTDLHTLSQALEALGQRLVVGVTPLHEAA